MLSVAFKRFKVLSYALFDPDTYTEDNFRNQFNKLNLDNRQTLASVYLSVPIVLTIYFMRLKRIQRARTEYYLSQQLKRK